MATRRVSDTPPRSRKVNPAEGPAALTKAAQSVPAAKPRKRSTKKVEQAVLSATRASISEDERRGMIAKAAYLRAERRGFHPDGQAEDWLAAEQEVDALLNSRHTAAQ